MKIGRLGAGKKTYFPSPHRKHLYWQWVFSDLHLLLNWYKSNERKRACQLLLKRIASSTSPLARCHSPPPSCLWSPMTLPTYLVQCSGCSMYHLSTWLFDSTWWCDSFSNWSELSDLCFYSQFMETNRRQLGFHKLSWNCYTERIITIGEGRSRKLWASNVRKYDKKISTIDMMPQSVIWRQTFSFHWRHVLN